MLLINLSEFSVDEVALAAIQGFYQLVQEQQREIAALKQENQALRQESAGVVATLTARLEALEAQASGKVTTATYRQASQ